MKANTFFEIDNSYIERAKRRSNLNRNKILELPYPFKSLIAIANDIDFSSQIDHNLYTKLFSNDLGLDFSDSCFLYSGMSSSEYFVNKIKKSVALFNENLQEDASPNTDYSNNFNTIYEEFKKGNIDHFHGLSDCGPVFIYLPEIRTNEMVVIEKEIRNIIFHSFDENYFTNLAIKEIHIPDPNIDSIELKTDLETVVLHCVDKKFKINDICLKIQSLKTIKICSKSPKVVSVSILNFCFDDIKQNISKLRNVYGITIPLLSDHASTIFLNRSAEQSYQAQVNESILNNKVQWSNAKTNLNKNNISVLGDDPNSKFYIIQNLKENLDLRFINPSGISGEMLNHFDIFEIISPTIMRNKDKIYIARRLLIQSDIEKQQNTSFAINRRAKGFHNVIEEVVKRLISSNELSVFIIYTHLGFLRPDERAEPYYDLKYLKKISNSYYGKFNDLKRIWFTKAVSAYDYSLIISNISNHTYRFGDKIFVFSWRDKVLKKKLPLCINQMNGVTFEINDYRNVKIYLDFQKIDNIAFYADSSEKKFAKIVGKGYTKYLIKDSTLLQETDNNKIIVNNIEIDISGMQYLKLKYRISNINMVFGFIFEMSNNETFYIGCNTDISNFNLTAYYFLKFIKKMDSIIIPLYDFVWIRNTQTLLTHKIQNIKFITCNKDDSSIFIDEFSFFKPTTLEGLNK